MRNDRIWPKPASHLVIDSVAGVDRKQAFTTIAKCVLPIRNWTPLSPRKWSLSVLDSKGLMCARREERVRFS